MMKMIVRLERELAMLRLERENEISWASRLLEDANRHMAMNVEPSSLASNLSASAVKISAIQARIEANVKALALAKEMVAE